MSSGILLSRLTLATLLVASLGLATASADPAFTMKLQGAADGRFSTDTKAEVPPEFEYRRFANEGTNREGPYELEFAARTAPLKVFGVDGTASIHLKIDRPLEPGKYEIGGNEEQTPVSVNVYLQDEAREMDEKKLWFIGNVDGSLLIEKMDLDEITGNVQFTIENRSATHSLTVTGSFVEIPYQLNPDIKVELKGAFKQPEPPPFMEAKAEMQDERLIMTLEQQWGFTVKVNLPADAASREKVMVGDNRPASAQLVARGHDPFPLEGSLSLDRNGDFVSGDFNFSGSIKGQPGSLAGWFDFVPLK